MRSILFFLVIATSTFLQTTNPGSADQIRAVRQAIDEAFKQHNARRLAIFVSADCHFTVPSVHTDGADALESSHASLFKRGPDVTLTHHANRIVANEAWDLASEQGDWIERWTEKDGVTELRGTYLTMWKREDGHSLRIQRDHGAGEL